jgi:hypothetical protein
MGGDTTCTYPNAGEPLLDVAEGVLALQLEEEGPFALFPLHDAPFSDSEDSEYEEYEPVDSDDYLEIDEDDSEPDLGGHGGHWVNIQGLPYTPSPETTPSPPTSPESLPGASPSPISESDEDTEAENQSSDEEDPAPEPDTRPFKPPPFDMERLFYQDTPWIFARHLHICTPSLVSSHNTPSSIISPRQIFNMTYKDAILDVKLGPWPSRHTLPKLCCLPGPVPTQLTTHHIVIQKSEAYVRAACPPHVPHPDEDRLRCRRKITIYIEEQDSASSQDTVTIGFYISNSSSQPPVEIDIPVGQLVAIQWCQLNTALSLEPHQVPPEDNQDLPSVYMPPDRFSRIADTTPAAGTIVFQPTPLQRAEPSPPCHRPVLMWHTSSPSSHTHTREDTHSATDELPPMCPCTGVAAPLPWMLRHALTDHLTTFLLLTTNRSERGNMIKHMDLFPIFASKTAAYNISLSPCYKHLPNPSIPGPRCHCLDCRLENDLQDTVCNRCKCRGHHEQSIHCPLIKYF